MASSRVIAYFKPMATVKKGALTPPGKWWKHLRWTKRAFWKGERQAQRRDAGEQLRAEDKGTPRD